MLRRSLEKMSEVNLFGNGCPMGMERRNSEMYAEGEFTFVVDGQRSILIELKSKVRGR